MGRKLGLKSTVWTRRKKHPTRKERKTRIQKNEERLRNLQDIFKHSNIQIIGVPEGVEEEQETEILFEKIIKEKFPNLVKEIDMQVQEAQRVPIKLDPESTMSRHIIIKNPKKESILKAAREKHLVTPREFP